MRNLTVGILICFLFGACEPSVTFDKPQPDGVDALDKFPKRLQGDYANQKYNSLLSVQEQIILRTYDWTARENLKNLDSNYRIEGGQIISLDGSEKYPAQIIGDSIEIKVHNVDTTFRISQTNVLKKFKGYYFLNSNNDSTSWSVTKLSLTKGFLSFGSVSSKEEINLLREITETTSDTVSMKFRPTQKQFKQFIKQNGFGAEDVFVRIKK